MGGNKGSEDTAETVPTVSEATAEIPTASAAINTTEDHAAETASEVSMPIVSRGVGRHESRHRLLSALKPYVSSGRGRALDSMEAIADILEMLRS